MKTTLPVVIALGLSFFVAPLADAVMPSAAPVSAQLTAAEEAASAAAQDVRATSVVLRWRSDDPRIINAAAECSKALAGKLHIRGYGVLVEAMRKKGEAAIRAALVAALGEVPKEVWNNFVQIPTCAAVVADLYINPGQVGEGDFGAVSSNFVGPWNGTITQTNPPIPSFSIAVTIDRGDAGSTIASGYYTGTSPCNFHWTLLSADTTHLVVNEVIDSGDCFNNIKVTLTLLSNGHISYDFEDGNGRGMLQRS